MEPNRRRSERLLLTFPIRVEGADLIGTNFSETTRTLVVNRHGARIQLGRSIVPGQTLRILILACGRQARGSHPALDPDGRRVGRGIAGRAKEHLGDCFPPLENKELPCSGLLECRGCQTVGLANMSLVELDVLNSSGILNRMCKTCDQNTVWGYPHQQVGGLPPGVGEAAGEGGEVKPAPKDRRTSPRVNLRMPIQVRNWYGAEELTKSENVSKGGLAFISEKRYELGEAIQITCPYNPAADNIESRARVVRRSEMKGTGRWIYGVRYEAAT